jgi:hypothetical protein
MIHNRFAVTDPALSTIAFTRSRSVAVSVRTEIRILRPPISTWYWVASNASNLADDRSGYFSSYCTSPRCQGGNDGSCCDQRSNTGDCQHSQSHQATYGSTEDYAATASNCGHLKRFVVLHMGEAHVARLVGKKNRYVILRKTRALELVDDTA